MLKDFTNKTFTKKDYNEPGLLAASNLLIKLERKSLQNMIIFIF